MDIERSSEHFLNKEVYKKPVTIEVGFSESHADVRFGSEMAKLASPEIIEVVKKDKFIRDSLRMLFEHDQKTFAHSIEAGNISKYMADKLAGEISPAEAQDLVSSGLLHDYGKVAIEQELLNKKSITSAEKEAIKKHVIYSFDLIKLFNRPVAEIVIGHHEHQRDSYPRKANMPVDYDLRTAADRTIVLTRVLAMIDAYEAMIADRPGNPSKDIQYVESELQKQFRLPGDQEIIFLLSEYHHAKNPDREIDAAFNN